MPSSLLRCAMLSLMNATLIAKAVVQPESSRPSAHPLLGHPRRGADFHRFFYQRPWIGYG